MSQTNTKTHTQTQTHTDKQTKLVSDPDVFPDLFILLIRKYRHPVKIPRGVSTALLLSYSSNSFTTFTSLNAQLSLFSKFDCSYVAVHFNF